MRLKGTHGFTAPKNCFFPLEKEMENISNGVVGQGSSKEELKIISG